MPLGSVASVSDVLKGLENGVSVDREGSREAVERLGRNDQELEMTTIPTDVLEDLPPDTAGLPPMKGDKKPGMLYVRTTTRQLRLKPVKGATVMFGRNADQVHITLGAEDQTVSRVQGSLTYRDRTWWLQNLGRRNLILGKQELFRDADPYPLATGFTTMMLWTSDERVHTMEFYLSDGTPPPPRTAAGIAETSVRTFEFVNDREKLAVVAMAQPYLTQDESPEPWAHNAVANLLTEIDPDHHWGPKVVERKIEAVKKRLIKEGEPGLTMAEVGTPVGNRIKHNMIKILKVRGAISPKDLDLLDD